ncbi:hypothetical protein AMIS_38270 [Actinoplanes missouriensis 431]|uniref:Uncharacterized protein n=1 Tax=Actinoplanes missouriensis (strain ATCC 14538 / DSM 43046 / CBS 188.64 / JCM 3121 / NBRC 102363 / NCIMB 12654 / NRRL B-3342 / UNCC 431) TaxID=512565 RepID=I0H7R0_ACTM4|nr:hypothetical protein AMIS_38270 [Actinoplanes missouriensis 431]
MRALLLDLRRCACSLETCSGVGSGYLAWLAANPDGYVFNSDPNWNPHSLTSYRAGCPFIQGVPASCWPYSMVPMD